MVRKFSKSLNLSARPETSSSTISLLNVFFHPLQYHLQCLFSFFFEKKIKLHIKILTFVDKEMLPIHCENIKIFCKVSLKGKFL